METFDLTTQEGKNKAKELLQQYMYFINPIGMVACKIVKMVLDSDSVKKQGEAVEDLIRAGKSHGVDEMDIVVDSMKGIKMDIPDDVKISTELGSHEKIKIHVKYK